MYNFGFVKKITYNKTNNNKLKLHIIVNFLLTDILIYCSNIN